MSKLLPTNLLIRQMKEVSDDDLRQALHKMPYRIPNGSYETAFACYEVASRLQQLEPSALQGNVAGVSGEQLARMQKTSSTVYLLYVCFMMMLCQPFLNRLREWASESPPLQLYRQLYHGNDGRDSLAWNIRGALGRGCLFFGGAPNHMTLTIVHNQWRKELLVEDVVELCGQVFRLMRMACQVSRERDVM